MGKVRNDRTKKILTPMMVGRKGRKRAKVHLCVNGCNTGRMVAHLVAEAFIGPRPVGMLVLHNNGNEQDNRAKNLRYGSYKDNAQDARKHNQTAHLLTLRQVETIRRRRLKGERGRDLAQEFGVSEQYICDIHKGRK